MKELKIISLFSGYGTQELALKYSGINYKGIAHCDILGSANSAYKTIHNTFLGNLGDIKKIDEKTFPECDFLTYSFPCFTKDTLVLTDMGYKNINDINIGDNVLTHTNTYKPVINKFIQGKKEIWTIVCGSVDVIETTENHRFFVKSLTNKPNEKKVYSDPHWKECKDLDKTDYLGIAINTNSIIPKWDGITIPYTDNRKDRFKNDLSILMDNGDFWWVIGRYIGDGWERHQGGIIICCSNKNDDELDLILSKLKSINLNYVVVKERTSYKIHISKKEIGVFVSQFGKYAHGKKLTNTILDLPINLLEQFIIGYHSADGNIMKNTKRHRISSVSRELIYGVGQCVAKVYNIPYSIYKHTGPNKYMIEDREVNQRPSYTLTYSFTDPNKKRAFYENGYIWTPISQVINTTNFDDVYDIEVDTDHSFTANGCIAHNCQDISISGIQKGIKVGTRSGLLYEVERIVEYNKPKFLLMENVKNLVSNNHIQPFKEYINKLESLGYGNSWMVINGADYGCPQNRERVFMFSVLGEDNETVKNKMSNVISLKQSRVPMDNFIEKDVDESLYITPPYELNEVKKKSVCNLVAKRTDIKYDQSRRIYGTSGCSPCLTTSGSPQIMVDGRIRTLTAREGYRFMGVKDDDIDNLLTAKISTIQHIALAGNSICVPVMMALFEQFFSEYKIVETTSNTMENLTPLLDDSK